MHQILKTQSTKNLKNSRAIKSIPLPKPHFLISQKNFTRNRNAHLTLIVITNQNQPMQVMSIEKIGGR